MFKLLLAKVNSKLICPYLRNFIYRGMTPEGPQTTPEGPQTNSEGLQTTPEGPQTTPEWPQ